MMIIARDAHGVIFIPGALQIGFWDCCKTFPQVVTAALVAGNRQKIAHLIEMRRAYRQ